MEIPSYARSEFRPRVPLMNRIVMGLAFTIIALSIAVVVVDTAFRAFYYFFH